MGSLLSKNKSYHQLDEYAIKYAGYQNTNDDEGLNDNFNNDIINIKQDIRSCFNEINKKLSFFKEKHIEFEKELQKRDKLINILEHKNESNEIHLTAITKLLEERFDIYNKDLESLLKNDKIILKKIEELHPEIRNSKKASNSIDIIKNSFLESNIEYSSFINE